MDARATSANGRRTGTRDELVASFAHLMRKRHGVRVYLFGSRARGTAHPDSDYDLVAVSSAFAAQRVMARALDRFELWREAGGWGIGLDLHCYTPEEFRAELAGLGFIGQARRRGELTEVDAGTSA